MKKKKTHDKAPADFKNNPFRSLKGFSPPAGGEKISLPRRKKEEQHEDDSELFLKAVAGARKMDNEDIASTGKAATTEHAASNPAVEPQDRRLFLEAMQKIGTTFKHERTGEPEALEPERRSVSSRMRQLKRGTIRVGQELDLHGFLRDEALKRLEQFITGAFDRGQQAVLVISGKGINSPDGPVLQGAVSSWLREKGKRMVAEFAPAPRDMGGSGAFVVFLRKRDGG
jgi:DNA-nicking Smr family endonuclease